MTQKKKNGIVYSVYSVGYGLRGLWYVCKSELLFSIAVGVVVVGIIAAFFLNFSFMHILFLILSSAVVLAVEALNTAIEFIGDKITSKRDNDIKVIKDISAGATLLTGVVFGIAFVLVFIDGLQVARVLYA
ncbi:MAG: diacylglycerol kinase [Alphaproteobacteria bacterium]|nr:diacylglycerol kinase [Alphaproteobacteria bacterium]